MDKPTSRRTFRPRRFALVWVRCRRAGCGSRLTKGVFDIISAITTAASDDHGGRNDQQAQRHGRNDNRSRHHNRKVPTPPTPVTARRPTNATPVPAPINADGSVTVTVTVGTDDFDTTGGKRVVGIKEGSPRHHRAHRRSTDESTTCGYDIEANAAKGATAKMSFTADKRPANSTSKAMTRRKSCCIVRLLISVSGSPWRCGERWTSQRWGMVKPNGRLEAVGLISAVSSKMSAVGPSATIRPLFMMARGRLEGVEEIVGDDQRGHGETSDDVGELRAGGGIEVR
jgi:hypothetical protein